MIDPIAVYICALILGTPLSAFALYLRHRRQTRELDLRVMEAQVKLLEAQQALPAWVDPRDPASLLAWRQARAELDQAGGGPTLSQRNPRQ